MEESLQEQVPGEGNQTADVFGQWYDYHPVQCRDLACDIMRCQRAEDLSDEMPLRRPKTDPVGHAPEHRYPEGSR